MDGVDTLLLRECHNSCDVQIGFHRALAGARLISFIRFEAMEREAVFLRVDGHGAQAEFIGGAEDAYGDFAAIGGKQFADRFGFLHLRSGHCVARNSTLFHGGQATRVQFFACTKH